MVNINIYLYMCSQFDPHDQLGERGGVRPPIANSGDVYPSDESAADLAHHELRRLLGTDAASLLQKNTLLGKK